MRWEVGQVVWAYERRCGLQRLTVQRGTGTGRPRTEGGTPWNARGEGRRGRRILLTDAQHERRERVRLEREAQATRRAVLLAQRAALVAALPSEADWLVLTDEGRAAWLARLEVADASARP